MRRLVAAALVCAACASPPQQSASLVLASAENCVPASPCERTFWSGDTCVREPLPEGSACLAGARLCPAPGVCRVGQCLPPLPGKPIPIDGRSLRDGESHGATFDDGSILVSSEGPLGPTWRLGPEIDREQVKAIAWLVSGDLVVGTGLAESFQATLVATQLDGAERWKVPLAPMVPGYDPQLDILQVRDIVDTGAGLVVVHFGRDLGLRETSWLVWVRLADGSVARVREVDAQVIDLAADEEGQLYASVYSSPRRIDSFDEEGTPRWSVESAQASGLRTFGGRLFEYGRARATSDGRVLTELVPQASVLLASPDVVISYREPRTMEFRDPVTLAVRAHQAGVDWPFALTNRGTVLATSRHEYSALWCLSDCKRETGEILEWDFSGALVTRCEQLTIGGVTLAHGVLWTGWDNRATSGVQGWKAPGLELAPVGWVTRRGGPGAGMRPR